MKQPQRGESRVPPRKARSLEVATVRTGAVGLSVLLPKEKAPLRPLPRKGALLSRWWSGERTQSLFGFYDVCLLVPLSFTIFPLKFSQGTAGYLTLYNTQYFPGVSRHISPLFHLSCFYLWHPLSRREALPSLVYTPHPRRSRMLGVHAPPAVRQPAETSQRHRKTPSLLRLFRIAAPSGA